MTATARLLLSAGLTGRGGAGFPTGVKVAMAQKHRADLIVNACDGEPGSRKDAWVIAHRLSPMMGAARQLSGRVRIAAPHGSATLAAAERAGVETIGVPHRYVSSEESSLASLAAGGLARPVTRFSPLTSGVGGRRRIPPTLVLNAETVWRAAQIMDRGVRWFRSHGTDAEPGPHLVTLGAGVAAPGVYEAEAGSSVDDVVGLGGGPVGPVLAVWLGGLGGGFLGAHETRTPWSRSGTRAFGFGPGAGVVSLVDARLDPWELVADALGYAVGETSGQCGPCRFGVPALHRDILAARRHPAGDSDDGLARRLDLLSERGACRFPDGIAGFVRSALRVFGPVDGRAHPWH